MIVDVDVVVVELVEHGDVGRLGRDQCRDHQDVGVVLVV